MGRREMGREGEGRERKGGREWRRKTRKERISSLC